MSSIPRWGWGAFRLGGGELDWLDRRMSNADDRYRFLDAVSEFAPQVLTDLAAEPLRRYRDADLWRLSGDGSTLLDSLAIYSELLPVQAALEEWAGRWHLSAPWVLGRAFETLSMWRKYPELAGIDWVPVVEGGWTGLAEQDRTPPGTLALIEPYFATREEAEGQLRRHIQFLLQGSMHSQMALHQPPTRVLTMKWEKMALHLFASDAVATERKRSVLPYRLLVHRLVLGLSPGVIDELLATEDANGAFTDISTINKATKALATRLGLQGLPLPGRPPKG